MDRMPFGCIVWDPWFRVISWNPAAQHIFGYRAEEMLGKGSHDLIVPRDIQPQVDEVWKRLLAGDETACSINENLTKDGRRIICEWTNTPLKEHGQVIGILSMVQDITEQRQAQAKLEHNFKKLQSLRTIDVAIAGSLDLSVTLEVVMDQVVSQLEVDAAAVLLLNPHPLELEHAGSRGFKTANIKETRMKLGQGIAGKAARERQTVLIANLDEKLDEFPRAPLIEGEGFKSYFSAPLISKGEVQGVLELFHRGQLQPDQEWIDFFQTLAGQTAIALDNARLFSDMQSSRLDLMLAYDATIEGWAKAVDYRDKETEGHSQRVSELTVRLAKAMGIKEDELVHIKRGALLHDIGKLGVPDSILFKDGELTEEEWEVMKRHPKLGRSFLQAITFLKPAADIPYCHHEKWDGSGYPRGIKGEDIPLSARMFAVVDCWDALASDRPYRPAWPKEKIREHIQSLAGVHFDPKTVEKFLSMEL